MSKPTMAQDLRCEWVIYNIDNPFKVKPYGITINITHWMPLPEPPDIEVINKTHSVGPTCDFLRTI